MLRGAAAPATVNGKITRYHWLFAGKVSDRWTNILDP